MNQTNLNTATILLDEVNVPFYIRQQLTNIFSKESEVIKHYTGFCFNAIFDEVLEGAFIPKRAYKDNTFKDWDYFFDFTMNTMFKIFIHFGSITNN